MTKVILVNDEQGNIIYKITYEEVDGQYIQVVLTTQKGIEVGLPVYDGELVFIQIDSKKLLKLMFYTLIRRLLITLIMTS
nr:hypothetical protein QOL21_05610 [Acholeplasma laidlawii]